MARLFKIRNYDGETLVGEVSHEEVLKDLMRAESDGSEYIEELPEDENTNYWEEGSILLIEGKIVRPRPKKEKVVESWEVR